MKGLLVKDIALMRNQMKSFVIILAVAILIMMTNDDVSIPVVYVCMVFSLFGINSISYDDFDNGYGFLFTLPINRKQYVLSKYVFSLLSVLTGVLCSVVFMAAALGVKGEIHTFPEQMNFVVGYAVGVALVLSVMLPIQLKYGSEKGRIALLVIAAIIVASAFFMERMLVNVDVLRVLIMLGNMNKTVLGIIGILICICIIGVSYFISCKVMEKKEF